MPRFKAVSGTMAMVAALTMAATPAAAVDLPVSAARSQQPAATVFKSDDVNADGYRHRRHRDRVDAGDLLAGVLILGGIAAIASAASGNKRDRDYRDDRYRTDYRYRPSDDSYRYRPNSRATAGSGIDNAVNLCAGAIERDVRVASVDGVDRNAAGWLITGTVYNGDGFSCRIDGNGRVDGISYGQGTAMPYSGAANDRQWDDERYAAAWAQVGSGQGSVPAATADDPLPAYPGGPLPGEERAD